MKMINRTGLEDLTCVVKVENVDFDTSGGIIQGRPIGVREYDKGDEITLWHSPETGFEIEERLERGEEVEVIVDHPFKQPDGRLFGQVSAILG